MPYIDGKTAAKKAAGGELANIYYIYGADVVSVEKLTRKIIKAAVGDAEDFALTRMEGGKLDVSELRDTAEMFPMASEYNCILVNDFNCEEQREEVVKAVVETIKEIPSQTVLIFNVTGFDIKKKYDDKARRRVVSDKNKKLISVVEKLGEVVEFPLKTPDELAKDIAASVSARGGAISLDAARELAERCLCDPLTIRSEIDKLCAYSSGREITRGTLDAMVHTQSGANAFALADAVAAFNRRVAFDALDEIMADKSNRGFVLSSITNSFLDLYRVVLAKQAGKTSQTVVADFDYFKRKFAIEKLYKKGRMISLRRLRSCLRILRDTNERLNASGADEKIALEEMVVKMLNTKN